MKCFLEERRMEVCPVYDFDALGCKLESFETTCPIIGRAHHSFCTYAVCEEPPSSTTTSTTTPGPSSRSAEVTAVPLGLMLFGVIIIVFYVFFVAWRTYRNHRRRNQSALVSYQKFPVDAEDEDDDLDEVLITHPEDEDLPDSPVLPRRSGRQTRRPERLQVGC